MRLFTFIQISLPSQQRWIVDSQSFDKTTFEPLVSNYFRNDKILNIKQNINAMERPQIEKG